MGPEKLAEILEKREEAIRMETEDPFYHGYEPEHWALADDLLATSQELLVLGGNRAGKSMWSSKRVVKTLVDVEKANVLCMHTTASTSVEQQQRMVWNFLPLEWKRAKKGRVTNLTFSHKNGFTEGSLVAPNESRCYFRNYSQNMEGGILEGSEWDLVVCDELVPLQHVESLRFRLVTRANKPTDRYPQGYPWRGLIITFTPIQGYSPTVKDYLQGAIAEKTEEADPDLLPGEQVPVVMQPVRKAAKIVFFHSIWNGYNDYGALKRTLEGETRSNILCRAYGVPSRQMEGMFPMFGSDHCVDEEQIPEKGTNYMVVDPSGARNWFIIWIRCTPEGRHYVYREFPPVEDSVDGIGIPGEWALPGKKIDGDKGPAQQSFGWSLKRYMDEIVKVEAGERITLRVMDSRFGSAPTPTKSGVVTLLEQMSDLGMHFEPSSGTQMEEGYAMINDALHYDKSEDLGPMNSPKLFISKKCRNVIFALSCYTGKDGKLAATKDPVDCIRYYLQASPACIEGMEGMLRSGQGY